MGAFFYLKDCLFIQFFALFQISFLLYSNQNTTRIEELIKSMFR